MYKLTVTRIKNNKPFLGKIRITLMNAEPEKITVPLIVEYIFCKGKVVFPLVPSEEFGEDAYYKYQIFPQGHTSGVWLHTPVESNSFKMPSNDVDLDDLIPIVPSENIPKETIPEATRILLEMQEALTSTRECMITACQCKTDAQNLIEDFNRMLNEYEEILKQRALAEIEKKKNESLQSIQAEQELINTLWQRIQLALNGMDSVDELLTQVRLLHETYITNFNQLAEQVNNIHIPTHLSELINDIFIPITSNEINRMF